MARKKKKPELIDQRMVEALRHPLRVELLDLLTERVLSPKLLKDIVGMPLSHVSYHVRVLERCDAIELVRQEQRRGAFEHFFKATSQSFIGSPEWRRIPKILLGTMAGASLESFIEKAVTALEAGNLEQPEAVFTWMPIVVDETGKKEISGICQSTTDALLKVQSQSQKRLARKGDGTQYLVGIAGFEAAGSS
jgi:DNA-binding transcriptional ArsR family regulator